MITFQCQDGSVVVGTLSTFLHHSPYLQAMFTGCKCALPTECCDPYTVILPEEVCSVTMTALKDLLEDGTCQVISLFSLGNAYYF